MLHVLFTAVSDPALKIIAVDRVARHPRTTLITGKVCIYLSTVGPNSAPMSWDLYHEINEDWKDTWLLHMVYVHRLN